MATLDKEEISLETERLIIRTLKPEDITEEYIAGLNDKSVNYYLTEVKRNIQTLESVNAFIMHNLNSANEFLMGVFLKAPSHLIGTIRLSNISYYNYCLGVGICIFSKKYWGRGYATESLLKVKEFIFNNMGMHYIEAGVYSENAVSIRLFKKAGFEVHSRISNKYRLDDKFVDVLMFRTINPNFNFDLLGKKR